MPPSAADLRAELKRLRRDDGRTLAKLVASPAIRAALGDPPEHELRDRFDAAVRLVGADLRSLALKNAYGIGLKEPGSLTKRREDFGAKVEVNRGPETINNWENEKIEDLTAILQAGQPRKQEQLLVAVVIDRGRISVVAEGLMTPDNSTRQLYNPQAEAFIPAFIYRLPPYMPVGRLTIAGLFVDAVPAHVEAMASSDLLALVCGDGRQSLAVEPGGLVGVDAAAHVAIHWDEPEADVYFGFRWPPA